MSGPHWPMLTVAADHVPECTQYIKIKSYFQSQGRDVIGQRGSLTYIPE